MRKKNWNLSYNETEDGRIEQLLLRIPFTLVGIGLSWLAFFACIQEWWGEVKNINTTILIFWVLGLWIVYEIVIPRQVKGQKKLLCLVPLIGVGVVSVYSAICFPIMQSGLSALINQYLEHVNNYFGTNYGFANESWANMGAAFTVVLMLVWLLIWVLAYGFQKRFLVALFPTIAIVLSMMVGITPAESGVKCLFAAVMFLMAANLEGIWSRVWLLGLTVVSLILTSIFMTPKIEDLSRRKDELIFWQRRMGLAITGGGGGTTVVVLESTERVSNLRPNFYGDEVLSITTRMYPSNTLYLKGFYGTEYVRGYWARRDDAFVEACKQAGYSEEEASKKLSSMLFETSKLWYERWIGGAIYGELSEFTVDTYVFNYEDYIGNVALLPYNIGDIDDADEYTVIDDYLREKSYIDTEIVVGVPRQGDSFYAFLENPSLIKRLPDPEFRAWYNEVAKNYLDVPDDMVTIKKVAAELKEAVQYPPGNYFDEYYYYLGDELPESEKPDDETIKRVLENIYRARLAGCVYSYLDEKMSYSLVLDDIELGDNPLEYALTKGFEGYCKHFASIATLMLREMGVPTRYVSGYVVYPQDFEYDQSSRQYIAEIDDYHAHAWIEVYFDDIGWIPLEMTPAYDDANRYDSGEVILPTEDDIKKLEDDSEAKRQEILNQLQQDTPQDELPDNEAPVEPEEPEVDEPGEDDSNNPGDTLTDQEEKISLKVILKIAKVIGTLILIVAAFFGLLYGIKEANRRYHTVFERMIQKGQYIETVRGINRRISIRLLMKNLKNPGRLPTYWYLTDKQYESALKTTFTETLRKDWENYMTIVKKVHYSKEPITEKEALFCYQCYKNCWQIASKDEQEV